MDRPAKRQRISGLNQGEAGFTASVDTSSLVSLRRPVTPPLTGQLRRDSPDKADDDDTVELSKLQGHKVPVCPGKQLAAIRSPVQLTHILDLPSSSGNNVDTVKLKDILGNPLIRECWQFNYCFDVDFIMDNFDEDVKGLVQVKIVHGSWKKDSPNRIRVDV
jgi:tyrosyl-DNA phosphodiesterase-1